MDDDSQKTPPRRAQRRIPPVFVVVLGFAVGFLVASWMGAVLGGLLGGAVWWSRARS